MRIGRTSPLTAALLGAALALGACSGGSHPAPATPSARRSSASAGPSATTAPAFATPVWQQSASYGTFNNVPQVLQVEVYPLQRIDGRLLLTVDLVAQGSAGTDLTGVNWLCSCESQGDFQDVSLVDTTNRVRYGPLRAGSATGTPFSSNINRSAFPAGTTWRVGGFFPDPGPGVTSMGVDLQLAGIAPAIPIVDGGTVAPSLVDTTGQPGQPVSAPNGGNANGPLTTWPTGSPTADAFTDRHDLVAKIVGGTVNQSRGIVTLNADVLFAFNSAKLSSKASSLVGQARSILTSEADPSRPATVIGYTDSKGSPGYNQGLSQKRAAAVTKALRGGDLGGIKLTASGRGEDDPVAPNTKPGGGDNPAGRALNRRVEISYAPKPAPAPSSAATPEPTGTVTDPAQPVVSLPAATVRGSGVGTAPVSATVHPIVEDGTLSLVSIDVTAQQDFLVIDAFSSRSRGAQDISDFSIEDPSTKRVYIPAYDKDDFNRVMGTYTRKLSAGQPMHLDFYADQLPSDLSTATVDVSQIGDAKGVTVVR